MSDPNKEEVHQAVLVVEDVAPHLRRHYGGDRPGDENRGPHPPPPPKAPVQRQGHGKSQNQLAEGGAEDEQERESY